MIEIADIGLTSRDAIPATLDSRQSYRVAKQKAVESFERDYLGRLMREHGGNVSHAARAAGKDRRDLGKLLKKYREDPLVTQSRYKHTQS
jgi:transcriptional regulator with GAF, ATPase, and Fis domain